MAVSGVLLALASALPTHAQPECRQAAIRSPLRGARLLGVEPILGSARIDDFAFYKLEWASQANPDSWSAVSTIKSQPVVNGLLDEWDTSRLPDGPYRLRLVVVDPAGREVCIVAVEDLVIANQPTATPTATATIIPPGAAVSGQAAGEAGQLAPGEATELATSTPLPTATLAPIVPRSSGSPRDALALESLWRSGPLRKTAVAFANGLLAALVLMALALAIGRRRGP